MARRASKINELRQKYADTMLLVDAGDNFMPKKKVPELRADHVMEGVEQMHYDAVTFGEGELNMDFSFLEKQISKYSIPLVSSNIQIRDSAGKDVFLPYIVKQCGQVTIGITGVTATVFMDDHVNNNERISLGNPLKQLRNTVQLLKGKVDLVVVLSHFGFDGTVNLFKFNNVKGVDVAVAGHGRKQTRNPKNVNGTVVVQNSMGGEYLSVLSLELNDAKKVSSYTLENIALTKEIIEDPFLKDREDQFKMEKSKTMEKIMTSEQKDKIRKMSPMEFIEKLKKEKKIVN